MRRLLAVAALAPLLAGGLLLALFAVLMGAAVQEGAADADGDAVPVSCAVSVTGVAAPTLDADQLENARTIIATGAGMSVPVRGRVVAIATAMQESTLRNLTWGDRDSVGLFQQRPSAGWGTVAELTTPSVAARKFYAALLEVPGWQDMAVTVAAQTVQRSAFPLAYARWEPLATQLVGGSRTEALSCGEDVGISTPVSAAGAMVRAALAQQGEPYVWGAVGPDAFDCSGLIVYAWKLAGYRVTVRTAAQMYGVSTPVAAGSEQPGDLLFGDFDAGGPGHVMIVVRRGLAVQAPHTGDVVKLTPYADASRFVIGRLRRSALERLPAAA